MNRSSAEGQYQSVSSTADGQAHVMPSNMSNGGLCGGLVNKTTREWFRSAEMEYVSLGVQEHCAHRVVTDLGRLGVIQFTDLNPDLTAFQRRYMREIKRCDELERKLRYFNEMLEKHEIRKHDAPDLDRFLDDLDKRTSGSPAAILDQLEVLLEEKESELISLNGYGTSLTEDYTTKLEYKHVLTKALFFSGDGETGSPAVVDGMLEEGALNSNNDPMMGTVPTPNARGAGESSMRFRFVMGVVGADDRVRFERMIFRVTRGNCYMRFSSIEDLALVDPKTNKPVERQVFIVFFQAAYIEQKLKRICDAFGATQFDVPDLDHTAEIQRRRDATTAELRDRDHVMRKNKIDMTVLLKELAKYHEVWRWTVMREKSVYHTLNHFMADVSGVLRAEGWVVSSAREQVANTVRQVHHSMMGGGDSGGGAGESSITLPSWVTTLPAATWPKTPPTYFHVNRFTGVFQNVVNTYGIPRYQEANPALFTVVSFPFFFGVMFGDLGHGMVLFLVSSLLVIFEAKIQGMQKAGQSNEIFDMVFGGRYIMVLMGFFATYAGLLYNDCFGLGLKLFTPTWQLPPEEDIGKFFLNKTDGDPVYVIGVDPTWHLAANDLLFFNSLKMKMAIIFGVTQMTFGICLKIMNAKRWKPKRKGEWNLDLWFEGIPQLIFMTSLFGYMCFLIILKWCLPWFDGCGRDNCSPPSLITILINIGLSPGGLLPEQVLFSGQNTVQVILLLLAVAQVPIMLVVKPYILIKRMRNAEITHHGGGVGGQHANGAGMSGSDIGSSGEFGGGVTSSLRGPPYGGGSMDGLERTLSTGDSSVHDEEASLIKGGGAEGGGHDEEEHGVGDIVIHQAIETIEFCLGCISNTASYLRLWALSLAHSQLAIVFWEMTLLDNLKTDSAFGVIACFIGYAVLAGATIGVLLCMDNLECFLHSLRLHWVEFQDKFYSGDGILFAPLSFKTVLTEDEE